MGSNLSQIIAETKESGGLDFILEGNEKIKKKELRTVVETLSTQLPSLQSITLHNCKLKALPLDIGPILSRLSQLSSIHLPENVLTSLPESFGVLGNFIRELNLSNNKFEVFPVDLIAQFKHLHTLDLSYNQISNVDTIKSKSLQVLKLHHNQISQFPVDICLITSLIHLDLNSNGMKTCSELIGKLVNLQDLNLSKNDITVIPYSIGRLHQLRSLELGENRLCVLPDEGLKELQSLTSLSLQHNRFLQIPSAIFQLTTLGRLKLNDNKLQEISPDIGKLTNLVELYLQENELVQLPSEMESLTNLRKMYLEYNKIQMLPDSLVKLKRLTVLILHHNQLINVPQCIRQMSWLLRLSLDDNPLDEETIAVIRRDGALALVENNNALDPDAKYKTVSTLGAAKPNSSDTDLNLFKHNQTHSLYKTISTPEPSPELPPPVRPRSMTVGSPGDSLDAAATSPSSGSGSGSGSGTPNNNSPSTQRSFLSRGVSFSAAMSRMMDRDKDKDSNNNGPEAIPSFHKFKNVFDNFVEQHDFSKEKVEVLNKLPTDKKWNLLKEYKESTLDMMQRYQNEKKNTFSPITGVYHTLRGNKSSNTLGHQNQTPAYFNHVLQGIRVTKKDLTNLCSYLEHNEDGWLAHFVEGGGIQTLIHFIQKHSEKPEKTHVNHVLIYEGLRCIKPLLENARKTFLTSSDSVVLLTYNLIHMHSNNFEQEQAQGNLLLDIQTLCLEMLEDISGIGSIGEGMVIDALQHTPTTKQVKKVPSSGDTLNVPILQEHFSVVLHLLKRLLVVKRIDTLVIGLSFVNLIVNNCEDLVQRFELRTLFLRLGYMEFLKTSLRTLNYAMIHLALDYWEDQMHNDEEELLQFWGRARLWNELVKHLNTYQGDFVRVSLPSDHSTLLLTPTTLIPYSPHTVIKGIIEFVKKKTLIAGKNKSVAASSGDGNNNSGNFNTLRNNKSPSGNQSPLLAALANSTNPYEQYGLFLHPASGEGFYLEEVKQFGDYRLTGELFVEVLLKPWPVTVKHRSMPQGERSSVHYAFPPVTHGDHLKEGNTASSNNNNAQPEASSARSKGKNEMVTKELSLDPNLECGLLLKQLVDSFQLNPEEEYCLELHYDREVPIRCEDTKRLADYGDIMQSAEEKYLELKIKPRPLQVIVTEEIKVFYFDPWASIRDVKLEIYRAVMGDTKSKRKTINFSTAGGVHSLQHTFDDLRLPRREENLSRSPLQFS